MRTRLSPAASEDLAEVLLALSSVSPSGVRGFRERFRQIRTPIGDFPHAGRQTDDPALRCVNMGRYPYLVFFERVGNEVAVMRIIHGARDPRSMPAKPR